MTAPWQDSPGGISFETRCGTEHKIRNFFERRMSALGELNIWLGALIFSCLAVGGLAVVMCVVDLLRPGRAWHRTVSSDPYRVITIFSMMFIYVVMTEGLGRLLGSDDDKGGGAP